MDKTVYEEHGYNNRKEYLLGLAETYGIDVSIVFNLAFILGPSEDFDGLVTELDYHTEVH